MLRRALRRFTRRRQGGSGGYQVVARGEARDGGVVAGGVRVTRPGARHVHAGRAARQADARVRHRPVGGGGFDLGFGFYFTPGAAFDPRRRARAAPPRLRAARQLHGNRRRAAHRA